MRNKFLQACLLLAVISASAQQNVGIGTLTPSTKAMLEVKSPNNDKGFLLPRMTSLQRLTINPPDVGLIVYDTNDNLFYYWNGTTWKHYPSKPGDDGWIITGTDVYSSVSGNVGIGLTNPSAKLHVLGTVRLASIGATTTNLSVLTVDGNGNVQTRQLPSDIWDGDSFTDADSDPDNECISSITYNSSTKQLEFFDACGQHSSPVLPFNPNDNDGDPTNEFQDLQALTTGSNVTISISDGTAATFSNNDADANPTNEAQTLSISKSGVDINWNLSSVSGTGGGSGTFNVDDSDWDGAGTGKMYASSLSDNIGIGNSNPLHKLEVTGNIMTSGKFYANSTSYYMQNIDSSLQLFSNTNIKLQTNKGHLATFNHSGSEAWVNYSLNSQDVMTLRGNGSYAYSVGIGTQTPANKLQVAGDVRIGLINPPGFSNGGNASGNTLYFSGGPGFVGIDSDNDDLLFMSRYNGSSDESELRIGVGDDANQSNNTDRLSIGSYSGGVGSFTGLFDFEIENPGSSDGPMLSISPSSTSPVKNYNGGLAITKPVGDNGQYINLARGSLLPVWSIGYQYGTNRFAISEGTTNDASFAANPHFSIEPGGNVGLGVADPQYQLHLSTDNAAKAGTITWTVASDKRLKTDIKPFTAGLSTVKQINPVRFHYNGKAGMPTDEEFVGIIAQDIQKIAPYMIGEWDYKNKEGGVEKYLSYDGNALFYLLVNSIKEQQEQIEQLQRQNTSMVQEMLELKNSSSLVKK